MSNPECGRKVGHDTKAGAKAAMRLLAQRTGAALFRLGTYRCRSCQLYHVGHLPSPKQRR